MNARVKKVLEDILAGTLTKQTKARAAWLLSEEKAKKQRKLKRSLPRRKVEQAAKVDRKALLASTRSVVVERAGGLCELCLTSGLCALELHHLMSGPLRRKWESATSMILACRYCHEEWHRNKPETLQKSYDLAVRIGAPDVVLANLNRRVRKVCP